VSVSPNSDCQPCNYVGPSIVINELNVFPNIGDGCIFGKSPDPPGKGEWIELFNPNWCDSLDISNYILGSYNSVNISIVSSNGMAFILPKGLILPPLGFAVIRGSEAPKPPLGVIDVVVTNNGNNLCIDGGISSSRMWFANNGGWLALYNASGIPQDAIKWSFPALTDLNKSPCIPLSNALPTGTTSLPSFNQISSLGLASTLITPTKGKSFRRFPDGGSWSSTLAAENSSYGTCNDIVSCAIFSDIAKCNGSATVNINSGVEPFTFQWNDPLKQTKQTATNLCEGTYNVVVTDANACSKTYNVVVGKGVFSITAVASQPGCSISNGSINFNPPNYSYKWTPNVSTSNIANNLAKGVYKVVISEGLCTFDTTIVLQNPTAFSASVNSTKTSCGLNNGSAEIIVDIPGNYTFSWTPNVSSTKLADNLPAGDYFIAISDNTCEKILTASIDSSLPISAAIDLKNTFCNENNGVVQIDLSPLSNYSYSWTPNVSNSNIAQNLQTGSYNISFTDGICSGDTTVLVSSTPVVTDILYKITPTNCGTSNGAISVNEVLGGKMPFLFSFNEQQSFSSSTDTSGLSKKEYSVSVKDSNNCIFQKSFSISEIPGPNSIISEQTNPICGDSSGIILLKGATGGISPYSYKWDGQTTTNTLFSELTIGTYSVEVIDNYGCSFSKSIDLINDLGSASIFIPNVFTPNSDENSVNEFWKIETSCVESISGVILNRWGDPVFKFDDLSDKWDGKTLSGDPVTDGVYFYKVSVSYLDDTNEILHGNITVIR
jgi:gliding motility-associated-like protein